MKSTIVLDKPEEAAKRYVIFEDKDKIYTVAEYLEAQFRELKGANRTYSADMVVCKHTGQVLKCRWVALP